MNLNGILVVNKDRSWTSHDVVAKLRNVLKVKKVGHAGTLDPMATGVLLVLLGRACKLSGKLMELPKTYYAEVTLGATSDTYDAEGKVVEKEQAAGFMPAFEEIKKTLEAFEGEIEQVPPKYSAKKLKGKKAYELARAGKEFELEAKKVTIYSITDLKYEYPLVKFRVECSKGTYVRSLAHDLGEKLGTGGYLSGLVREKVGDYTLEKAYRVEEINLENVEGKMTNSPIAPMTPPPFHCGRASI